MPGTQTLYLLRDGESELNVLQPSLVGGRSGWCELTPDGIAQARRLGDWLAAQQIPCDRVVASTAVRAQQTARYALEAAGIPLRRLETSPLLEEQGQGEWENRLRTAVYTPEVVAQVRALNWHFRAPGGESFADVAARVGRWLAEVGPLAPAHADADTTTGSFCHGGVIRAPLTAALGLPQAEAWRIPVDNTSVTVLQHTAGGWSVGLQNHVP